MDPMVLSGVFYLLKKRRNRQHEKRYQKIYRLLRYKAI